MRVAGIMSGTSLDGVDVAVVDVTRSKLQVVAFASVPYPATLRERILEASNALTHTAVISRLNFELGERYAAAVRLVCRRKSIKLRSIDLIGCHGQTIFHERGNTLQIGESSVIAERLKIPVVSDFRTRDIAAGGLGAPLVPFVDYRLFRHRKRGRVALNIGGIANITSIPANAKPSEVIAFDTGPGNMVIDALMLEFSQGRQRFDRNGAVAAKGGVNKVLLEHLLHDPYYTSPPPKTAGREQYGQQFVDRMKTSRLPLKSLIATATAFTASTIALGIERFVEPAPKELIVAGGGIHNRTLMSMLAALMPHVAIATSAEFGIPPDAKEAIAFAVLAWETFHRRPSNVPSATGARHAVVLGKLTPAVRKGGK
jgi:anhydro-N-acetylmuramic acid kinase